MGQEVTKLLLPMQEEILEENRYKAYVEGRNSAMTVFQIALLKRSCGDVRAVRTLQVCCGVS